MSFTTRRKLLRMASSSFLALPLLRLFREEQASAAELKRVLFVYFPTGCYPDTFFPKTATVDSLPVVTAPLMEHKKDLIFIEGLCHKGTSGHTGGPGQTLAGRATPDAKTHSLDHMLAESMLGQGVMRPSIALGLATTDSGTGLYQAILYKNGRPSVAVDDPKASYADIFGSNLVAAGKKRVIDYVRGDLKRIEGSLGPIERPIFQSHVAALDDLNKDIVRTETEQSTVLKCYGGKFDMALPGDPEPKWFHKAELNPTVNKFNRELMVQSLACNATRVGVMQYSYSEAEMNFQFEGRPFQGEHYHGNSHVRNDSYLNDQNGFMTEIAKLIGQLKAAGIWNDTLLVVTTCQGNPNAHTGENIACFLGGGMLKGNRKISYPCDFNQLGSVPNPNKAYNHLLVTVAHLMGQTQINHVGSPEFTGPLKEVMD